MLLKSDIVCRSYDNVYRGLLFPGHSVLQLQFNLEVVCFYRMNPTYLCRSCEGDRLRARGLPQGWRDRHRQGDVHGRCVRPGSLARASFRRSNQPGTHFSHVEGPSGSVRRL